MDPLKLPSIRSWAADFSTEMTPWDVANFKGGLELAVVFTTLFFPEFRDVSGYLVLKEGHFTDDGFSGWLLENENPAEPVAWDSVHVYDLFSNEDIQHDNEVWLFLAKTLQSSWQSVLDAEYPERTVKVVLSDTDQDYGPTLSIEQLPWKPN
jgi:hypothetical protein